MAKRMYEGREKRKEFCLSKKLAKVRARNMTSLSQPEEWKDISEEWDKRDKLELKGTPPETNVIIREYGVRYREDEVAGIIRQHTEEEDDS